MSTSSAVADFQQGIAAARSGHRLLARLHLAEAIDANPTSDAHWLWMAWVAESPAAAVEHLKAALQRNPNNEIAKAGLIWSQTMAEWDFERPQSPRATLAAVAEREARTRPPSLFTSPTPIAEATPEVEAKPKSEPRPKSEVKPKSEAKPKSEPKPIKRPPSYSAEVAPLSEPDFQWNAPTAIEPAAPPPAAPVTPPLPPNRPESLPIDQITGMFLGEGRQLVGDEFAGFQVTGESLDVVDATGSLSTPFAGGTPVGQFAPTRPPSSDLGTPFGGFDSADLVEEAPPSDSDFETIHPTNTPAPADATAPVAEAPAPPTSAPSFGEPTPSQAEVNASQAGGPAAVEDGATAENHPRKVLIVDDSPTVCKIVSITLKKRGFDVASAGDGVEAMALVASDRPDLILLDITMPRMDGYQLCKLIKGYPETKNIPVIMLSGKDGFFDRVRGKLVGCSDYITKPFDPELLVAAVERFLPAPLAAAAAT